MIVIITEHYITEDDKGINATLCPTYQELSMEEAQRYVGENRTVIALYDVSENDLALSHLMDAICNFISMEDTIQHSSEKLLAQIFALGYDHGKKRG